MPNPDVSNPLGTITWSNDIHNWRAQDADRLQARGVLRFTNAAARTAASSYVADGTIHYLDDTDKFVSRAAGVDKNLVTSNNLNVTDTGSTVTVLKNGSASASVELQNTKIVINGNVLEAGRLTTSGTTVSVTNADGNAHTFTRATGASGKLTVAGGQVEFSSGVAVLNGLTVLSGATNVGTLQASGTISALGGISGNLTGVITGTGTSTFTAATVTTFTLASGGTFSSAAAYNLAQGNTYVRVDNANGITLKTEASKPVTLNDGSINSAPVAGVIQSATAPIGDYPENTIWIQT